MTITLETFAADCKGVLSADSGPDGLEQVRQMVENALKDEDFLAEALGPNAMEERNVLYEDPDLGFCILAHKYEGPKTSAPHDHGPSWAIYGQAEGSTEMSDWKVVEKPDGEKPGKVEHVRTYELSPGDAHAYQIGDVHSPKRVASTKLIRIEGKNVDTVTRDKFDTVE